jgi:hypothetical protein
MSVRIILALTKSGNPPQLPIKGTAPLLREKIIWNFDNVQKAYATRGYEAKNSTIVDRIEKYTFLPKSRRR